LKEKDIVLRQINLKKNQKNIIYPLIMALNGNMDMQKMVFIYMMILQKMFTFGIVRVNYNFFVKIWHMEIL